MSIANTAQAEHWNTGEGVAHWISNARRYDRMHQPFTELILGAAGLQPGENVLDVGCGGGGTTLAAARLIAPGQALGVDLSAPMLDLARSAAAEAGARNADFQQDDVQVRRFGPASFDVIISRFGVMFFEDPVAAFANIRSAARPGARLVFVCWQPLAANDWLLVPQTALAAHVPPGDFGTVTGPGMFAFSEQDRVRQVLSDAGWEHVQITAQHVPLLVGGGGSIDDTVSFLRTATIGRTMLAGADEATTERAVAALRAALAGHAGPDGVHLGAGVWLVQAAAPTVPAAAPAAAPPD
jgi:SAM-dependent methyltransferase